MARSKASWLSFTALVLIACVAVCDARSLLSRQQDSTLSNPSFCGDLACPKYTLIKDYGNNVQLRRYENSTWAVTDVDEGNYEKATATGFNRLLKYILGDNILEKRFDMTAPVATTVHVNKDREVEDYFSVQFWLDTCSEPPAPKDGRVRIVHLPETEVYVLSFNFYALGFRVRSLAFGLMDHLESLGINDFDRSKFIVGVYDPPYKVWDRHNEIWLIKNKSPSPKPSPSPSPSPPKPAPKPSPSPPPRSLVRPTLAADN